MAARAMAKRKAKKGKEEAHDVSMRARLTVKQHREFKAIAARNGHSLGSVANALVSLYVKRNGKVPGLGL